MGEKEVLYTGVWRLRSQRASLWCLRSCFSALPASSMLLVLEGHTRLEREKDMCHLIDSLFLSVTLQ